MPQTDQTAQSQPDYTDAIGRTEEITAVISEDLVVALARTLDLETEPRAGDPLPGGWHWMFFNPFVKRSGLGADGHPKRGSFLPDVVLPRRMWAGGRLINNGVLEVGFPATRLSEITNVVSKSGRAGELVFVTVRHKISQHGKVVIDEEQDIVYREAPVADAPKPKPMSAPENAKWSEIFTPDPVLLFRYSAITSNGHRIHYDQPYATGEEGYRDLVVHGPLIATLLQGFAQRCKLGAKMVGFDFRGMAPLFVDRGFHLEAAEGDEANVLELWARGPDGELAMKAQARFEG